jgi:replicative DNA helicase
LPKDSRPEEKGLPVSIDSERFVLGSILLNESLLSECSSLEPEAFSLEKHRRIFQRMRQLHEDGEHIDRMTVANRLMMVNELAACGGLTYLVYLDSDLPQVSHIDSYVRIVQDKYTLRRIIFAGQHMMNLALENATPAEEVLRGAGETIAGIQADSTKKSSLLTPEQIMEEYGGLAGFVQHSVDPGVSWGFSQFDDHLLGLQPGCQYIIAGRTSSGKSALSGNVITSLAHRDLPVLFLSLEMTKEIVLARMICSRAQIPLKAYLRHELTNEQVLMALHAGAEISELPIWIDDAAGLTITGMAERVNEAVTKYKIRAFVLDHIHRVNFFGDRHLQIRDKRQGVELASWTACLLARQHTKAGNPLSSIVLCQLSRPADKRKNQEPPILEDLRETANLEQDATGVIMLHRLEQFRPEMEYRGRADAYIRKSRNGTTGKCELTFRSTYTKFIDDGPLTTTQEDEE